MIRFAGRGILLDIEGTTSSVRFVYDVLFPFARRTLHDYLDERWARPEVQQACQYVAKDAGWPSLADWTAGSPGSTERSLVEGELIRLMDADVKATGLKQIQGLLWREGYEAGTLVSHVYSDVPGALSRWQSAGLDLRIFSSGSVAAQKLFFGHTEKGDLTRYFRGHYDTTTGPKKEASSYRAIANFMELPTSEIVFCSDIVEELDAAREAGMKTVLLKRPGNAPPAKEHTHDAIESFDEILIA